MSGMDLAEIKALLEKHQKNNEKTENSWSKYSVGKDEIPGVFRIVPYKHAKHPFIEIHQHWDVGGEKSIVCPKHFNGSECPICDLAEKFLKDASFKLDSGADRPEVERKNNWTIARSLRAIPRYFSPVLNREKPELGVRLIGYSYGNYVKLLQWASDPDCGDFVDPQTGRDISFNVIKQEKNNKVDLTLKMKQTPLALNEAQIKTIIDSVPNYLEVNPPIFRIKTKEELLTILSRIGKEESTTEISISSAEPSEITETNVGAALESFLKESNIEISNE
jgi:hypothetical protein